MWRRLRAGLRKFCAVLFIGMMATAPVPTDAAAKQQCADDSTAPLCVPKHLPPIRTKAVSEAVFSPYVESWSDLDLRGLHGASVTLAFLLSRDGKAAWDGTMPLDHWLARAKASGKNLVLSFGGAGGTELALDHTHPKILARQYLRAATTYGAARLDFDIEGWSVTDAESVGRRNAALKLVQDELPGVKLQYTLPVMPHGLDAACLRLLRDAKAQGVRLDAVNVMAMNYGAEYRGDMGQYAMQAARATRNQLRDLGLASTGVGITPMIRENDVKTNVFTVQDAREVANFAATTPWVRFVGFWSAGRDPTGEFGKVFAARLPPPQ